MHGAKGGAGSCTQTWEHVIGPRTSRLLAQTTMAQLSVVEAVDVGAQREIRQPMLHAAQACCRGDNSSMPVLAFM